MDAELKSELDDAVEELLETYKLSLMYGDKEIQDRNIYLKLMSELCSIQHSIKRCEVTLEQAKEQANSTEEFERIYKEIQEKSQPNQSNIQASPTYKNFVKQLENIKKAQDDKLIISSEICTVDPLTKQQIQNPVRNTICGHYYEKTSIMAIITKRKQQIKCPVAGCGNNSFIIAEHLVEDNTFKITCETQIK